MNIIDVTVEPSEPKPAKLGRYYLKQGPRGGLAGIRDDLRSQGYSRRKTTRRLASLIQLAGSNGMSALQRKRAGLPYGVGWREDAENRRLEKEACKIQLEEQGVSKEVIVGVLMSRKAVRESLRYMQEMRD